MKPKNLKRILIIVCVILLIPLIAMQFTYEVTWSIADFAVAGILLLGTGLALDFVIRKITNVRHRIIISAMILIMLLLIWTELAVGVFGTPLSGS